MLHRVRLIDLAAPPECVACGAWAGRAEPLCGICRGRVRPPAGVAPDGVWAAVAYAGPARDVVAGLKFRSATRSADAMAAAIVATAPPGWIGAGATLVPVPLHPARRRRRGFNQAERIASAIGRRAGLPVADVLARAGPRATQMGRGRAQRLAALDGAVTANAAAPARAVLVDDVVTTGATLAACRSALLAAGAADVRAVAYARTPGR